MKLRFLVAIAISVVLTSAYASADLTAAEQTEMVAAHNKWRGEAGVPDLKWSAKLASSAQAWANNLKNRLACEMEHSDNDLGENLYWASALMYSNGKSKLQTITPTQVTNPWGEEKQYYNYRSNTCAAGEECGHYTQMVWKDTSEVGCAKAVCADKSQVWVCHYAPAGNYEGERPY